MKFTQNYFEAYMPVWRDIFFNRCKWDPNTPKNVLEIGSFEGLSTCWIMSQLLENKDSNLICIDTFEGGNEQGDSINMDNVRDRFYKNIAETNRLESIRVLEEKSDIALLMLIHENNVKFDFIYIDGSHMAVDVLTDLILSFRLLKIGGLCICDDYYWTAEIDNFDLDKSPKMAIDAFSSIYSKRIGFMPIVNTQFAFIRKL